MQPLKRRYWLWPLGTQKQNETMLMIFYAICIGFVIWLKHHHRGKPTLQPVFVFMAALLCKWYWLFFVIFIREEISLKKKWRILVLFGLNTRKIPTFCRLWEPATRKLIVGRNHELSSQLIRQNGRHILFRLDTNSLSINISTGMSDFLFALQNDLDVWQQRWWGMYMHEIHLQNRILKSYKTGKRLEIDFLFFSAVSLVAFMERKIALAALY